MRLPFEQRTNTVGSRHDLCRVTSTPAGERDLEFDARDPLYRLDHLEHGKTPAVTAIERGGDAAAAQIRQRIGMRAHEIGAVSTETLTRWVALLLDWPMRPSGSAPATLK